MHYTSLNAAAPSQGVSDDHALTPAADSGSSLTIIGRDGVRTPFVSAGRSGLQGCRVVRSPVALRLPSAFIQLKLAGWLINSESQSKPRGIREPVLVTHSCS
jgi:hypothetical protein